MSELRKTKAKVLDGYDNYCQADLNEYNKLNTCLIDINEIVFISNKFYGFSHFFGHTQQYSYRQIQLKNGTWLLVDADEFDKLFKELEND